MPLKIFISFCLEERNLAQSWGTLLKTISAGGIVPWFSSDLEPGGGLEPGIWRENLYQEIGKSEAVLAILTPTSLGHPWIAFECGVASGARMERILPILFRLEKSKLSSPLNDYQAYLGDDPQDVRRVCDLILKITGQEVEDDFFAIAFKNYQQSISLDAPKVKTEKTRLDLWVYRIEAKIRDGERRRVPGLRQDMYAALADPFTPTDVRIHDLLSSVMLDLGKYQEALAEIEYGLTLLPDDPRLLQRKAYALMNLENLGSAEEVLNRIYQTYPKLQDNNIELALLEGWIYWKKSKLGVEDVSLLEKSYEAFLKPHKTAPIAHCDCYKVQEQVHPGTKDYEMTQHCACLNAARVGIRLKKTDQMPALYERVLDRYNMFKDSEYFSCEFDLIAGEIFLGLARYEESIEAYSRATTRDPAPTEEARHAALGIVHQVAQLIPLDGRVLDVVERILSPARTTPDHPLAAAHPPENRPAPPLVRDRLPFV